jgi:fructokinase
VARTRGHAGQHADLIKVSDEDLSLLYPEQDPERVIDGWLQHRCQLVFLTRGGEGATVFSRAHGSWSVPACSVKIADTVGAGDTFQAALITWLTEQDWIRLKACNSSVASRSTRCSGLRFRPPR